jgi:hypothetical protein
MNSSLREPLLATLLHDTYTYATFNDTRLEVFAITSPILPFPH